MTDLEQKLTALRETTAADVAGIDIIAGVMTRTRRRPWSRARWIPLVAAALIALLVWRDVALARAVTIVAQDGWLVTRAGLVPLAGEKVVRDAFTVRSNEQPIILRGGNWTATLAGHGEAAFWWISEDDMKVRKAALAGAVAVVVVYGGVLTFEGASAALQAPAAALVGKDGRARAIDVAEVARLHGDAANDITVRERQPGLSASPGAGAPTDGSGGYWDTARAAVRFRLAGEVFDAQSGKPIDAFDVQVAPLRSAPEAPLRHRVTGSTDGHFLIDGMRLGAWEVTVRADGYAPSRQSVSLAAATDNPYLVVPLTAGARLTGLVVDWRGEPVAEASIALGNCAAACGATKSDAKGTFVLKSAPEDTPFTLVASHPRFGSAILPNLRVAEAETEHVSVTLSGIVKVSGHVYRGAEHTPAAGVVVKSGQAQTLTDATGAYALFIPLEGHPMVRVVTGSPAVELESYPESRGAEPLRWVTARTHVAELDKDFFLAMETGRLVGRISEADSSPVAGARLLIANTMGWGGRRGHDTFPVETVTDADGRYRIDDLPAHAGYLVRLARGDEERTLGSVALDEPREVEANFVLAASALHGRFVDATTREAFPMQQRACDGIGARRTGDEPFYPLKCHGDGSFDVEGIPGGRYSVLLVSPHTNRMRLGDAAANVPGSDVLEVPVEGERLLSFTARITDAAGSFVRGPMLRFEMVSDGGKSRTISASSLDIADDGTTTITAPASQAEVYIEAPGYLATPVTLAGRDPRAIIEVRLPRATTP